MNTINDMKTLMELFKEKGYGYYKTDKGTCPHDYLQFYDDLFLPFQDKEINVFEVGWDYGGSCKLWIDYFSQAKIRVIDLLNRYSIYPSSDRASLEIIDVNSLTTEYFKDFIPSIAIDDGSHILAEQIHFIKIVYPALPPGGVTYSRRYS